MRAPILRKANDSHRKEKPPKAIDGVEADIREAEEHRGHSISQQSEDSRICNLYIIQSHTPSYVLFVRPRVWPPALAEVLGRFAKLVVQTLIGDA